MGFTPGNSQCDPEIETQHLNVYTTRNQMCLEHRNRKIRSSNTDRVGKRLFDDLGFHIGDLHKVWRTTLR